MRNGLARADAGGGPITHELSRNWTATARPRWATRGPRRVDCDCDRDGRPRRADQDGATATGRRGDRDGATATGRPRRADRDGPTTKRGDHDGPTTTASLPPALRAGFSPEAHLARQRPARLGRARSCVVGARAVVTRAARWGGAKAGTQGRREVSHDRRSASVPTTRRLCGGQGAGPAGARRQDRGPRAPRAGYGCSEEHLLAPQRGPTP